MSKMMKRFRNNPHFTGVFLQNGLSLLEVVLSIAIMGILISGFIPAMMGITRNTISVDDRETAKNLAESQMEYIKNLPFSNNYAPYDSTTSYQGFVVDNPVLVSTISNRGTDIQSVTVVIRKYSREITRLTGYKMQ
jgi:prepilin-type N-terminal cleavage/methylation domain-containing protein